RKGEEAESEELRGSLKEKLPEYMVPAVFVRLAELPLTPNGKVDRRALPAPQEMATEAEYVAPRTPVEEKLAAIWASVLKLERVGVEDNFFELGGDSIISLQIAARALQAGLRVTPTQLAQHQTIAKVAPMVMGASSQGEQGVVEGPVPLTPIQHWFFEQEQPDPHDFKQGMVFEVHGAVELALLEQALLRLSEHHDALRMRYFQEGSQWRQVNAGLERSASIRRVDLSPTPEGEQGAAIEALAAEMQRTLGLSEGPLWRAALINLGAGRAERLLVVIHHFVIDYVSWRILLEDLNTVYAQLCRGEQVALPAKTTSFKAWAERLNGYAQSPALEDELEYWLAEPRQRIRSLPVDRTTGENTIASARSVWLSLDEEATRALLQEVPTAYRAHINDVLLAALAQSLSRWTGERRLLVNLEGHGREDLFEDVSLSRTVGWFTAIFPVLLDISEARSPAAALRAVREELRRLPRRGIGHGLLKYLRQGSASEKLRALPRAEVSFNYWGQFDLMTADSATFGLARESAGPEFGERHRRPHLLEVESRVFGGRLEVGWFYSENRHERATVEALAQDFMAALRALVEGRASPDAARYSPSDFPLAKLDQAALDRVLEHAPRIDELYPLSPMQQGLLFHALLSPSSDVYFEQVCWPFHARLDASALRRAWQAVMDRHPPLRTDFFWEGLAEPMQVVRPRAELPWRELDWRGLPSAEQRARMEAFLKEDSSQCFELARAPLMRHAVIRLDDDVYECVWSFHHLLLDGWSVALLLKEVLAFYRAFTSGQEPRLERTTDYREYIAWLREQDVASTEGWWRRQLGGFTAPTPLPGGPESGATSGEVQGHEERRLQLDADLRASLQSFARQHQLTLNALIQGAWAIVLSRHCGEQDIVFGTTLAGRPAELPAVESMVGLFINSLPLRVRLPAGMPLVSWLKELQAQQVELRLYEHCPLAQVQGWSDVPRGTSLFDSLYIFENYPVDESLAADGGLDFGSLRFIERTNYPLIACILPNSAGLLLKMTYAMPRFDAAAADQLLGHWKAVLESMVAQAERPLAQVPLLTEQERQRLLVEWNDTRVEYDTTPCVHQLFEAQVARTPDAPALQFEGDQLTYRELDRQANQLAWRLRALGVGPEVRVALGSERSLELVVGLFAILKAGGAYVPLDPSYPRDRLEWMLEDASPSVLLAQPSLLPRLPGSPGVQVVALSLDDEQLRSQPTHPPPPLATPDNLAYVIFTSGSTGRPKGAMNAHRAVCNRLLWMQDAYGLGAQDVVLQKTPYSFDVSVWEFFWPLMVGARLVLARPGGHQEPDYLLQLIVQQHVTTAHFVPSMLQPFLDQPGLERCTSLRRVVCSGEALPLELTQRCLQRLPSAELHNLYGPTEAAVDVTAFACQREAVRRSVPIGRPIANTLLRLLDEHLQPVPVGVAGELYIGGVQVGRGYLGRPNLTAERFVPDPFSTQPGARLYRTGDKARWLPDGNVEYLGRLDFQVKVRGLRIELGEIEAALEQHPQVRQAVVVVREDTPGHKRLVAYFVPPSGEQPPSATALRDALKQKLPEYMVPAGFVSLSSFPLTASGKVNRKALPAPDFSQSESRSSYVAPRNDVEQRLCDIWAVVLGLRQVGIQDNFFELGGDSIISLQIVARAAQAGLHVTLRQLFERKTVAELAKVAVAAKKRGEQGVVVGPVPLTPIQHWFFEQGLQAAHHFNQSMLLEVGKPVEAGRLEQALSRLLEHHDGLRLRFVEEGGRWSQVNAGVEGKASLERVDLSGLGEQEQRAAMEEVGAKLQSGLNLAAGPLVRAALFERGEGRTGRLLLVIHHLVVDMVSWRVLLEDLNTAYGQLERGQRVALPAKTTSFRTWAGKLLEHAQSAELEKEAGYWLAERRGDGGMLPVDRAGGRNTVASEKRVTVRLEAEQTQVLVKEVPAAYRAHIDDVLLTALARSLGKWTGQPRVKVDLEGHGREELFEDVDLSRTVGWFTTMYPVVLETQGASAGEALRAVREERRGVPRRGIGYGLLKYLRQDGVGEKLRAQPTAQVLFNYLGQFDGSASDESLFRMTGGTCGPEQSEQGRRSHVLEVSGQVLGGRLELTWVYSENLHERATIEALAGGYLEALKELIAGRTSADAVRYVPSDFPLARLEQAALDAVLKQSPRVEDIYPLSPTQQGMLFHAVHSPEQGVYLEQMLWDFQAPLDVAAFRKAWQEVVARNAILRTSFFWEGLVESVQVVCPEVELPWHELDLQGLSPAERDARVAAFVREDRARGFELSRAPLMRISLLRLDAQVYRVLWSFHHLLLDGWSVGLLIQEMLALYESFVSGKAPELEQRTPYRDYIAWLQGGELAQAESWWRKMLEGFIAPTPLPADQNPGLRGREHGGAERQLQLPAQLTASLQSFAREHQLTLNTLLQASWALLLSRYSGEQDV
ncbi:non-ribosomal peptide synthetase, partial [Archangium sp.]|uniref:non-ribosomal peptide synthetase n=1 Tax=Archangium sp. TaxID=1872627 RepID=UPI002D602301